ncbi:plasmid pRiA4b ORF-3 family protein [Amycolatopsis keratiniphila]|uniref:plasmid pRiA4b ORF-3 family protein n=1 Tax=Amycolatopsis keratiniphila TaxID=129921 RepID=UPI001E2A1772|nr:plasmid pRiA4b ORF-3 family protein [Amycolatopsis keratiniphila]
MSPVSRGRKPAKRPKHRRSHRTRAPLDVSRVERWPKLLHGPIELSGCVVQGQVDQDLVVLAATLTAGKRTVGVEVVVNGREVDVIELHPEPEDALAVLRNGFEVVEAPLTPEEFRSQVEAALIAKADRDAWIRERVPRLLALGRDPRPDLSARAAQLCRWLGLPAYEPLPRIPSAEPLPLVLPRSASVTGLRLAVALSSPDDAIWRRLEVRSDVTLAGLHRILAAAFDRDERRQHRFETEYGSFSADAQSGEGERLDDEVELGQIATSPGHRLLYEVEYWKHWIRVEQLVALPEAPSCLDGERAAPPAECEDEQSYEMLLEARRDPYDEENEDLLEELGGVGFDPEWFDREVVNERLARLS